MERDKKSAASDPSITPYRALAPIEKPSSFDKALSLMAWSKAKELVDPPLGSPVPGVSEFLCKRFGLQLTEMRSPN